jgi:hypothetical protein
MNNQLPKTIRFISGGVFGVNVYAIRDLLYHILSLNMGLSMMMTLVGYSNASRRHIRLAVSSRRHYVLVDRMLGTCRYCACSRGSGTLSTARPRDNTWWWRLYEVDVV